jgi:hypothetical protein
MSEEYGFSEYRNKRFLQNLGVAIYEMENHVHYGDRTAVFLQDTPLGNIVMVRKSETYWQPIPTSVREALSGQKDYKVPRASRRERYRRIEIWMEDAEKPFNIPLDGWRGDFFKKAFAELIIALAPEHSKHIDKLYDGLFNLTHASHIVNKGE